MLSVLKHRGLKLIFAANMISMIGSGMNTAAVTWYVLQVTHSEVALGTLLMLQTIPALLLLPFSGVVIDREDRRHLVMILDAVRALAILTVAVLAWRGEARLWHVYLVSIIVAGGFWMFWPTINALIQELTPESDFVHSNSFLIAGLQGGWLIAGAMVGFLYNWIGLSGILFIDFASYLLSFTCYLFVRTGRQTVRATATQATHEGKVRQYFHELREGIGYIRFRPRILLLGFAWAFFVAGMLSQGVLTAPYSDRLLNAGAYGYGWLNSGWAIGACLGAFYTAALLRVTGRHRAVSISMAVLGVFLCSLPLVGTRLGPGIHLARGISVALAISVAIYAIMGCARALGGVAITSTMMEMVPKQFMGRVQNTFYFVGTCLQFGLSVAIGAIAHNRSLAYGFYVVGGLYLLAAVLGGLAMRVPEPVGARNLVIG
ncbi:MAG TPA: MFS transporter [Candidatus Saccharimonadales bacterium]|jgi:DHA3 family macrolide efflux protein-like MFS transporter|nr:MFS transporter [Candidatus Saccharimonadales bacterium]